MLFVKKETSSHESSVFYTLGCLLFVASVYLISKLLQMVLYCNANEKSGEGRPSSFKSGGRGKFFPPTCPSFSYPCWKMLTDKEGSAPIEGRVEGEQTIVEVMKKSARDPGNWEGLWRPT